MWRDESNGAAGACVAVGESDPLKPREFDTEERWSARELNSVLIFLTFCWLESSKVLFGLTLLPSLICLSSIDHFTSRRLIPRANQKLVGMLQKLNGLYWLVTGVCSS